MIRVSGHKYPCVYIGLCTQSNCMRTRTSSLHMHAVDTREGKIKWSCLLVIWSKNLEYSILSRKELWSYCQSLGLEFRYALRKVLGTQDRPTLGLASHHCVLYLNPIKYHLNTCILDSHTDTHNMHLAKSMASLTLNTYLSIYPNKREPNI